MAKAVIEAQSVVVEPGAEDAEVNLSRLCQYSNLLGGIKRAPPVDIDELNFPGRKDVYHVKATNLVFTKPLTTQYSKMENTEMARESKYRIKRFELDMLDTVFRPLEYGY